MATFIPVISGILLRTRFRSLNRKRIPDYFNLSILAPSELKRRIASSHLGNVDLRGMPPSSHLAVFRLIKERGQVSEEKLDKIMTDWLLRLAGQRKQLH